MGTHQGTHLDAMFHFVENGRTVDQMPLEWFYGPARVLHIPKAAREELNVADSEPHAAHLAPGRDYHEVHHILLGKPAEIVVVESLANLDRVPDVFTLMAFPLNFQGRDGSPIRAVALV